MRKKKLPSVACAISGRQCRPSSICIREETELSTISGHVTAAACPKKQPTHLYLADESRHTRKEGSWISSKAIFNMFFMSLCLGMRAAFRNRAAFV